MEEEYAQLVEELVAFKTTEENKEELSKCADYIQHYFQDCNVHVKRFDLKGVPSLLITMEETQYPKLLLSTHFDVVHAEDDNYQMRKQGTVIFGRGVYDDKGPLAVTMMLMKELAQGPRPDVGLMITGDEEVGGRHGARYLLEEVGIRSDFCIVLDGGSPNHYVKRAKGILNIRFEAQGLSSHASRPWLGENAIEKLLEIYPQIKELFSDSEERWRPTMALTRMNAGQADNMVPGEAQMVINIRFTDLEEVEELLEKMREIMKDRDDVRWFTSRSPIFHTEEDHPLLQELIRISKEIYEEDPVLENEDGASDASYFSVAGIPTVLTRPKGGGLHSPDEFLDLENIDQFYNVLKEFSHRFKE